MANLYLLYICALLIMERAEHVFLFVALCIYFCKLLIQAFGPRLFCQVDLII